jgi:hypothetical protein
LWRCARGERGGWGGREVRERAGAQGRLCRFAQARRGASDAWLERMGQQAAATVGGKSQLLLQQLATGLVERH